MYDTRAALETEVAASRIRLAGMNDQNEHNDRLRQQARSNLIKKIMYSGVPTHFPRFEDPNQISPTKCQISPTSIF